MRILVLLASSVALFAQSSSDLTKALESPRQRIDAIDGEIVTLLNERAQVVHQVGTIKKQFHAPASAPGREEQVLRRVTGRAQAPLTSEAIRAIYKSILQEMTSMEAAEMQKDTH